MYYLSSNIGGGWYVQVETASNLLIVQIYYFLGFTPNLE